MPRVRWSRSTIRHRCHPRVPVPIVTLMSYHQRIHRQEVSTNGLLLHYDARVADLRPWRWPVTEMGQRVVPSDFSQYRLAHDFRGPSCLCAAESNSKAAYTEAAIFVPLTGEFSGEYVAACASDNCGYWICMERMYSRNGLFIRKYPLRDEDNAPPLTVEMPRLEPGEPSETPGLLDGRQYEMSFRTVEDQFFDLDSFVRPGIPKDEFKKLFSKCHCGLIMTKRVFGTHRCMAQMQPVVIDLTIDESDD